MKDNPFDNFETWFAEAKASSMREPTAMNLATATLEGRPSSRIVLLKDWDARGFVFYTNEEGRKGRELLENPQAAIGFYWMEMLRQVRIEGKVVSVSSEESDAYYNSRALGKRIGAWASRQSEVLESPDALAERVEFFTKKFGDNPPRPEFWHGYRVVPERFEFWQEKEFRLHQRDVFERSGVGWKQFQIYP